MDSDNARTRFLTAVSHDMRQPLQALLLYLGALDRRVKDEEARDVLAKADRAAQTLAGMFDALVLLARLEAAKIAPNLTRTSVQEAFESMQGAGVSIEATTLHTRSDPALLESILRQLVSNGLKHGGGAVRLSAEERNGAIEIAVADSGAGITPEDRQRIFDEFARLEGARADGLGLGLTIAQRLAMLLGHEIDVRSLPGQGATFVIRAESA
jgi:signal transduction histidine kinase